MSTRIFIRLHHNRESSGYSFDRISTQQRIIYIHLVRNGQISEYYILESTDEHGNTQERTATIGEFPEGYLERNHPGVRGAELFRTIPNLTEINKHKQTTLQEYNYTKNDELAVHLIKSEDLDLLHEKYDFKCPITQMVFTKPVRVLRQQDINHYGKLTIKNTGPIHRFELSSFKRWAQENEDIRNPLNRSQQLHSKVDLSLDQILNNTDTKFQVGDVLRDFEHEAKIKNLLDSRFNHAYPKTSLLLSEASLYRTTLRKYADETRTQDWLSENPGRKLALIPY